MKKPLSVFIFAILICSTCFPAFAQQASSKAVSNPNVRGAVAEYESMKAFTDGQGVYIRWEMKSELGNLGFSIFRMGDNGLEPAGPGLIMGSYSKAGQRMLYGEVYEMYDPLGTLDSTYVIQNKFVNNTVVSTDVFSPRFTSDFPVDTGHTKAELENLIRSRTGEVRRDNLALPSDLQAVVDRSTLPLNPEMQRVVVSQQGVKIAVKKEGMYRVTRAELQAAGFDVNSDPTNWRLFMNGNEQAIIVEPTGQYLDFYGKTLDVRETDTRTYFLISDTVAGKRVISKILNNIGGNVMSKNYRLSVAMKERKNYNPTIRNGDVENFWGRPITNTVPTCPSPNPNDPCLSFDLSGIDTAGLNASISLKIQGLTNGAHSVKAILNGQQIGFVYGANKDSFSADLSVPASVLVEGQNTLQLATSRSSDTCYFDSIKINYTRKYAADQNKVLFFTPGYRKLDVTGFTSPNIRVFDTTLDGHPELITDLPITQNGSSYSVRMPSNRPAVMYGVEDTGLLQSPSITMNNASTLASPNNNADMVIISHSAADFMAASETWANYRRSVAGGGFTVNVIDVADIFDEFSYGAHSATAVKDFLVYAKNNWQTSPRYVLLIGDASYDPRNYIGLGSNDLVPTKNVDLIYEETASDEALADFNHDGLAEMAIGRIPARTAFVINTVLNKTIGFETPLNQSLDRGALFAFDRPDGFDFDAMSQFLAGQLPASMPKTYVNRMIPPANTQPDPNGNANLRNAMNAGKYIVNYSGHGSAGTWASSNFFSSNDSPFLTNTNSQSIFTMLTCFNGLFFWALNDSLGEALLKANGGAVVTWASTTETTPDYQLTMGARFYTKLGEGNINRMGDLVIDAKSSIAGSDVGYSWALLGDPALKVRQ
ncbi:MAG: hypothetical protein IPL32_16080 [Chloracidobacterium sp.]|nr:hypothetical protein [Chloracidobacterium sp.]